MFNILVTFSTVILWEREQESLRKNIVVDCQILTPKQKSFSLAAWLVQLVEHQTAVPEV